MPAGKRTALLTNPVDFKLLAVRRAHGRVAFLPGLRITLKAARYGVIRTVGDHLRRARLMRRLLQKEVAEALQVSPFTVMHWEANETQPRPRDGPKIVALLGYLPLPTETLPERLYAVRFANGWTQREAGLLVGVSEDSWQAVEAGKLLMPKTMEKIEAGVVERLPDVAAVGRRDTAEKG